MSQSGVYVIGPEVGPQKIGFTNDPQNRLRRLQTGHPADLLVHHFEAMTETEARHVEATAHWLLKNQLQRGEWFAVTPTEAIEALKEAIATKAQPTVPRLRRTASPMLQHDGLDWMYRYAGLSFDALEAGLAYRELRTFISQSEWGTYAGGRNQGNGHRVWDANSQLRRIEGAVMRHVGADGLRALLSVAYRAEAPFRSERGNLCAALDVVAGLLANAKCA